MGLRYYVVIVLRGYGVKALHILGLMWLWGFRYIELFLWACVIYGNFHVKLEMVY